MESVENCRRAQIWSPVPTNGSAYAQIGALVMTRKAITVKVCPGMTTATELIRKANSFNSSVKIEHGKYSVNAKSLISLLSLGIKQGMELTIITDGNDENAALDTISSMIAG